MTVELQQSSVTADARQGDQEYLWSSPSAPRPRRMPGAVVFLIAAAIIAAIGMLYLLQTNHVANLGYEMSQLQAKREAALVEQQQLSAQIAEKQALTTVEFTARSELGMRSIDDYVFVGVELPPLEEPSLDSPPEPAQPSAIERFWNRLTGSSTGAREHAVND